MQFSTLSLVGSQFVFLKCDWLIQDRRSKIKQKQICFELFVLSLLFTLLALHFQEVVTPRQN